MRAIGRQLDQVDAAVFAREKSPDIRPFVVSGVAMAAALHLLALSRKWSNKLNLLRLKSKGSVFWSTYGAQLKSFSTEVRGFKPICGK